MSTLSVNIKNTCAAWLSILCTALIICAGCSGNDPSDVSAWNKLNIQKARNAYSIYASWHGYKGPESEEALKEYLRNDLTSQTYLKRMGVKIEELDEIFVSERDGEPFVIRWGVNGDQDHPIVFEKSGVDGVRLVSFFKPKEVNDEEYNKYLKGDHKPESESELLREEE